MARLGSLELDEVRVAARRLAVEIAPLEIQGVDDVGTVMKSAKGKAEALYVVTDPMVTTNRVLINSSANAALLERRKARRYSC